MNTVYIPGPTGEDYEIWEGGHIIGVVRATPIMCAIWRML